MQNNSVLGSAAECEIASAYLNAQEAVPIRNALEELGHHQPPAPMQVDNATAVGFIKKQIKQRRSKAIDMRYYWSQDRQQEEQFNIYWCEGM